MVKFLIHRPIAVLMTALAVLVLGLLATRYIPVSLMPDIDIPEITVQVNAKNMSAREMENVVVNPLRDELMRLSSLEEIRSETSTGTGIIRLRFAHGTNIQYSFIEVNEKIDRATGRLPRDIERPRVIKASATDLPVFYLNVTMKNGSGTSAEGELTQEFVGFSRFIDEIVKKRIEQLPEVAMVDVSGLVHPEIVLIPDRQKMLALGINLNDLETAIQRQNIGIGNVIVRDNQYQYNLRLDTNISSAEDIEEIYLNKHGEIYQLKDLAEVVERSQKRNGMVLFNDEEAIAMAVIKQSDARMGDLKEALNTSIAHMEKEYPAIDFSITRDQTRLLDFAITNLTQSLIGGMLLAFLVMFFFLKEVRSSLLIGISVPVSLFISLLFFQLFDISLNIISLSGLVLGTGLMIDNSIIVIDNITQYLERGYSLPAACVKGTNEIIRPLLSSVLTTCAVFIPLIFVSGITGALFYDQAMAVSIGLFVSLLISVTLLPVLFRLFHLKSNGTSGLSRLVGKLNTLDYVRWYEKGFHKMMRHQRAVFAGFFVASLLAVALYIMLPKRQMPALTNTETLLTIDWNRPISAEENKKRTMDLVQLLGDTITTYNAFVGQQQFLLDKNAEARPSEVTLYIKTASPEDLSLTQTVILEQLSEKYPEALEGYEEVDNIFNLIFSDDAPPLSARLRNTSGGQQNSHLGEMLLHLEQALPEEAVIPPIPWEEHIVLLANREKMLVYNISENTLAAGLESAFNSRNVLSLANDKDLIPVLIGSEEKTAEEVLATTMLRGNDSTYYPLNEFVTKTKARDLKTITAGKEGEYYPVNLNPDDSQEKDYISRIRSSVNASPHYDVTFTGSIFQDRELMKELGLVLCITLLLLYFILAAQFESLWLPLIILLEIPLAVTGALFSLFLFGMSINLMSMIGIVVMSGIIINDSILKIDTVIQLQRQGYGILRALLVAGQRRLKPILMTSLTTILALIPILFSTGIGNELQAPLAVSLIGGMIIGTLVSLYFIPLCYYHLVKNRKANVH